MPEPTVFILGAGASYGDTLMSQGNEEIPLQLPLITQFFDSKFLYDTPTVVQKTYKDLIEYIQNGWHLNHIEFGTGGWCSLNLEDIFTCLTIDSEFWPPDTDQRAHSQLLINQLKRYIGQVLSRRSMYKYGKFTRRLVESLEREDSIINFNYDLL